MPFAPAKPCRSLRCSGLAAPGSRYCAAHATAERAEIAATRSTLDDRRGSAASRGYGHRWAALSLAIRRQFPFSLGYLTRGPEWSPRLALEFHGLRIAAQLQNRSIYFLAPGRPGGDFLAAHPIYTLHLGPGVTPETMLITAADRVEVCDHIIPHRGDQNLFWAEWNLQALSKRQHDTKTATEDGGFRGSHGSHGDTVSQASGASVSSVCSVGTSSEIRADSRATP
jgi:5-methylcytosine-specific restriction protein A